MTFTGSPNLNDTSRSVGNNSVPSTGVPGPQQHTNQHPGHTYVSLEQISTLPFGYIPSPSINRTLTPDQTFTSLVEGSVGSSTVQYLAPQFMGAPSQAQLSNSGFHLTASQPIVPSTPESPELRFGATHSPGTSDGSSSSLGRGASLSTSSRNLQSALEQPASYLDDEPEDPEGIEAGLLNEPVLDRLADSNTLPFIVHSFASWMTRFLFEPARILPVSANHIRRSYSSGHKIRQTMLFIANVGLTVSRSTDYDLTECTFLHQQLADHVAEIRARDDGELSRELALMTMEHSHEFISTLFKVGSLAGVLSVMDLYAPVFRRACPEPSECLVNLPQRLTTIQIHLQYYPTLDVLQSIITHSPMFFRYDLDFLSPQDEALLNSEDGPGLRWLYGVPDRLMIPLARMNNLFEDFGHRIHPETIQKLENEIDACVPVVYTGDENDASLNISRVVVQVSWKMAAHVYLYMGLCGADSSDGRVAKIRKAFMGLLKSIKPRRNSDSFLILPIAILGVATNSSADQYTLLTRLWGVSECNRPGTVGNDIVRMLNDI